MVTATGYSSPENSGLSPPQPQQWEAFRWISSEMVIAPGLATNVYVGEEGPSGQLRTNGRLGPTPVYSGSTAKRGEPPFAQAMPPGCTALIAPASPPCAHLQ